MNRKQCDKQFPTTGLDVFVLISKKKKNKFSRRFLVQSAFAKSAEHILTFPLHFKCVVERCIIDVVVWKARPKVPLGGAKYFSYSSGITEAKYVDQGYVNAEPRVGKSLVLRLEGSARS